MDGKRAKDWELLAGIETPTKEDGKLGGVHWFEVASLDGRDSADQPMQLDLNGMPGFALNPIFSQTSNGGTKTPLGASFKAPRKPSMWRVAFEKFAMWRLARKLEDQVSTIPLNAFSASFLAALPHSCPAISDALPVCSSTFGHCIQQTYKQNLERGFAT